MKLFQQKMLAVAVVSALAGADALAQATLEEVVVTARKRAETLAESPISVKAFTDSEIRAAGISTPQDFVNLTPNVTLVQTQSAGNSLPWACILIASGALKGTAPLGKCDHV